MIDWLCRVLQLERQRDAYPAPVWLCKELRLPLKLKTWRQHIPRDRQLRREQLVAALQAAFIVWAGDLKVLPFDPDVFIANVSELLLGPAPGGNDAQDATLRAP